MDYLEYKDFLAHGRLYVSYDGGKTQTEIKRKPSKNSLGARIKRRLSGAKAIGSQTTTNSSVGGKSGRKWKNHKYIAIINGRYIYPAKKALKQTFTKEGRQAKRLALARSEGTAHERAAVAEKKYYRELNNKTDASRQRLNVGQAKSKQSREYGAAVQRENEIEARRQAHAKTFYQNAEIADRHSAKLRRMDRTEAAINRLRSAIGKEANASSKVAEPRKRKVLSKKQQHELNQQAANSANEHMNKNAPKQKNKKAEPKKTSEFKKSIKEIADYAGNKIKSGNVTFGPDPEKLSQAILEQKKKRKKK